jgi:transposase
MPKSHRPYHRSSGSASSTWCGRGEHPRSWRQFEPSAQAIRNWVRQADRDDGRRQDGLTTLGQDELRRLRRENRAFRQERRY